MRSFPSGGRWRQRCLWRNSSDATLRVIPAPRSSTGASLLIRPGERLALLGAERRRQVDRAPAARRRPASRTRRRARARPRQRRVPAPVAGVRRAPARCSTRCSSRSPTLQRSTTQLIAIERRAARGRARPSAAALRRAAGALPAPGRLRRSRRGSRLTDRRRLRASPISRARSTTLSGGERGRLELAKVLVQTARPAAARRADQPPGSGRHRTARGLPRRVSGRVRAGVARPRVHPRRLPRDRRARGRPVRPLPVRLRQVRRRARRAAANARAPPTSGRRSTSTRPRTSSAATSPGRRPSRRRAGARCWRSWSGWSGPTTIGSTRARSGCSFQTGGDLGSKETIRAPKLTVGYPDGAADPARRRPPTSTAATRSASSARTAPASRRC